MLPTSSDTEFSDDDGYVDVSRLGTNVQSPGLQRITLEWNRDCQVYSINGRTFWTNTDANSLSAAETHALMLTLEVDFPSDNGYNIWIHRPGDVLENVRTQDSYWEIDSVSVERKDSIDPSLCSR